VLEELFLQTASPEGSLPIWLVGSALSTMIAAIGVLYKRTLVLEDRQQKNIEQTTGALHATADAVRELTKAVGSYQRNHSTDVRD